MDIDTTVSLDLHELCSENKDDVVEWVHENVPFVDIVKEDHVHWHEIINAINLCRNDRDKWNEFLKELAQQIEVGDFLYIYQRRELAALLTPLTDRLATICTNAGFATLAKQ